MLISMNIFYIQTYSVSKWNSLYFFFVEANIFFIYYEKNKKYIYIKIKNFSFVINLTHYINSKNFVAKSPCISLNNGYPFIVKLNA